ncbi:MAG TPA: carbohydrate binding domain-containing protein [Candidatus Saccharimonadales bacterium]|nr:carbohydrate binding domain-containing protein [Candidatus Saccharimonadales bacterium]
MFRTAHATAGINQQINFQGRLLTGEGAVVPDGSYNIEFKIYQDGDGQSTNDATGSPAGTLKWTEDYLNANSQGVVVQNGYFSVQLGSITPFGSNIDWNQGTLWLSLNIGGTGGACTPFSGCSPDGEMLPMKRLAASPYALNSGELGGLTSAQFVQLAQGVQTDASVNTTSIYLNKTGGGNFLDLQSSGNDAFVLSNSGDISFGANANHTIAVAQAGAGIAGKSLTITGGAAGTGSTVVGGELILQGGAGSGTGASGSVVVKSNGSNSTGAFQVQNASGVALLAVDTAGGTLTVDASGDSGSPNIVTINAPTNFSGNWLTLAENGTSYLSVGSVNNGGYYEPEFTAAGGNPQGQAISFGNANGSFRVVPFVDGYTYFQSSQGNLQFSGSNGAQGGNAVFNFADTELSGRFGVGVLPIAGDGAITIHDATAPPSTSSGDFALGYSGSYAWLQSYGNSPLEVNPLSNSVIIGNTTSASAVTIQAGTGGIVLGASNVANTIQIGSTSLSSGTQTISIGTGNTAGGTTNVTIGSASGASGGTTTLQAKGTIVLSTNGVTRGTFDTSNSLYLGNGLTAAVPNDFTIQGTGSAATAIAGGSIIIQGGNATVGTANGGNLTLSGGAGAGSGTNGLVILTTPTFQTAGTQTCASNCTVNTADVNSNGVVVIDATDPGVTVTLGNPGIAATYGRIIYVTAANGSDDFTLEVNGGGVGNDIAMRSNTTATMVWGPGGWTAAGASSSTTLQAAYDNTLTSAGGAELIVSESSNHDGLTIRDSASDPVSGNGNGTLLEVQSASAAQLFSVDSNVTDYSTDGGAETENDGTPSVFPAGTWAKAGNAGVSVSRYTTAGNNIATGQASVAITTTTHANDGVSDTLSAALTANLQYNVSFTARLSSGTFTTMNVYYSVDGTAQSVACITAQAIATSVWTKVNCSFTAPASGIAPTNAILIEQSDTIVRTFYVDNLSVTISAGQNYATDGSVNDQANFAANWPALGGSTTTWDNTKGNDASDSAKVVTAATANQGVKNVLSIKPLTNTLYRISIYATSSTSFTDFTIGYSPDDGGVAGTHFRACTDYNAQTIPTSGWQQVTCYIQTDGTAVSTPRVYLYQASASARTFWVDTFSMTLAADTTPNVQIGGGINGGPVTLLTLDSAAGAPIAANDTALLGSMYYDTTLGKLQCYEADGWGACGSSPDNIVTLSPEYTNAVLHGTGVGTMTSDFCSDTLNINDGSGSQPAICGANETYNFYKWTSPQATAQTYSIYVTYQLPQTFKGFASGQTSLMGRTDSSNATVQYSVYKNDAGSGLTQCGSLVAVSSGSVSSWQTGTASGAADPSTCGFVAGDSIVFKIDVIASQSANAYVGNLGFTFSNN